MEWLTSPRRFRPAFQFLQNVTHKVVPHRKQRKESESEMEDDAGSSPGAQDNNSPRIVQTSSTDSGSSGDDKRPRSDSMFDDPPSNRQSRSLCKTRNVTDISDSRSTDSVFDDADEAGITHRRHTVAQESVSSTNSAESQRSQSIVPSGCRKQGSLTIQLPSNDVMQRNQLTAPPRSPRLLRVDQFDITLYGTADSKQKDSQDEQPALGRISTHVAYDVDTRTLRLALISTSWLPTGGGTSPCATLSPSTPSQLLPTASMPPSASSSPAMGSVRHSVCLQVTLMPDRLTKQSAVQRSARSIQWKEELQFTLEGDAQLSTVCDKWVQIVFTEFDRNTRPLGVAECRIELGKLDLLRGEGVTSPLTKCSQTVASCGQLLISLHYLPNAGRLNVDVLQAKGLLKRTKGKNPDTYVKVILSDTQGRCCKNKKTCVVRNCAEPQFNETFVFDTNSPRSETESFFDSHTVSVYLYASSCSLTERDELLGRVLFGPSKYASGQPEKDNWCQLRTKTHVKEWYDLNQPGRYGSDSDKFDKVRLGGTLSMLA